MRNWTQHLLQAASCKYEYSTSRLFRSPYCTNSQSTPTGSRKSATASLPSHFICFFCVTNCHFSSILDCILHSHCIQLNYRISHVVPGTQDQLNHWRVQWTVQCSSTGSDSVHHRSFFDWCAVRVTQFLEQCQSIFANLASTALNHGAMAFQYIPIPSLSTLSPQPIVVQVRVVLIEVEIEVKALDTGRLRSLSRSLPMKETWILPVRIMVWPWTC